MALQHLRSSTADKRPTPTSMADGQVALNTAAVSPGVFFKDAGGSLVKVGPVHVGTTAPNVSPAGGGHAGNSIGEQWLDTTGGTYVFKVWDGSAWRSETGTFVDVNGDVMTGALGIIAGTAGGPGLYISGDTNTGIYSPGADQVAISTAGTGRLTVSTTAVSSTLAIDHPLGAVGTPSITFTGDLNTGFWSPAADTLAASTAGAERLRITSTGRVGIGTTSPSAPLEVTSAAVNGVASEGIRIHMPGSFGGGLSGNSLLFTAQDSGSSKVIYSSIASLISSNTAGSHAGILTFNTVLGGTNTERARIDASGRLGIGTASPGSKLHVAGETVLGDDGTNGRLTVNTTTSTVGLFATTTGFGAYEDLELRGAATIFKRDGTNESARIDSSGRLLVGTSTSAGRVGARLQIAAGGADYLFEQRYAESNASGADLFLTKSRGSIASPAIVNNGDNISIIRFSGYDGSSYLETATISSAVDGTPGANDMPGRLVFSTTADGAATPTEAMRINNQRELLIGTTTRTANGGVLQVSNGITFPATAVACTNANTLDDYEEGTHTATLTPSTSGSITLNASFQTLTYTKIGRLVSIRGVLIASSSSSPVGYVTVSLPFTPAGGYAGGSVFVDAATGVNMNEFVLAIVNSAARIYLGDGLVFQADSAQAIASAGQIYLEMNYHV